MAWGLHNARLPGWFNEHFPARYTTRTPFDSSLPAESGLEPLIDQPDGVRVSIPERALLEVLHDVGVHQGVEEARNLMEGLRSLRPELFALHLKHCQRVNAARLGVRWSEELGLPWARTARNAAAKHPTGGQWSARQKTAPDSASPDEQVPVGSINTTSAGPGHTSRPDLNSSTRRLDPPQKAGTFDPRIGAISSEALKSAKTAPPHDVRSRILRRNHRQRK